MSKFLVNNILWDTTDGSEEDPYLSNEELQLPTTLLINTEYLDVDNEENMDEIESAISDYLSDEYGFCHFGFDFMKT